MFGELFVSAAEAARRTGQSERTIRRWIERGTLQTTKHGSTFQIALTDLDHFVATHAPDINILLARVLAAEDLADVQASQAHRLTELERRVFFLEQRLSVAAIMPSISHLS